jgi:uncharacterized protein YndB with AHSA1/START domain
MQIDNSAPATFSGQIEIDAEPQAVFDVLSEIDAWPLWNADVRTAKLDGALQPGSTFHWTAGPSSLTSTLQVVDPPREIGWTGTTMGIRAVHVFRFEPSNGGTIARSEESWDGLVARVFKCFSKKSLEKAITRVLASLKAEAERKSAAA